LRLSPAPGYNQFALRLPPHTRLLLLLPLPVAALGMCSCTAAFGPGYTIESQEIHVQFAATPQPQIHVESFYQVRNTGNQPVSELEVRLPARRSFHVEDAAAFWDGAAISASVSPANPRDAVFALPAPWKMSDRHALRLSAEFRPAPAGAGLAFTSDAFFLPSEGWAPELLPTRGLFGTGGVPPKQWRLFVRVPQGFLVHASGRSGKTSRNGTDITVESVQTPADTYPFVIAGAYHQMSLGDSKPKVLLWTRAAMDSGALHDSVEAMTRVVRAYDTAFGNRAGDAQPLWMVECPVVPGCFSTENSSYADYLGARPGATSAELASADALVVDFAGGTLKLAGAAPALAASWLGYGRNPGFYDQEPPLSALPAFASSLGREAILGPAAREEAIRRALQQIPRSGPARRSEDEKVLRAKSFLFFYALQQRYGPDVFRRAIGHMLSARRGRGFSLDDLIAAFEQETHQNVAEFVRLWMKHPSVPDDFRASYEGTAAALATTSKENMP